MLLSEIRKMTLKDLENKNLWYELKGTDILNQGDLFIYTNHIYTLEEVFNYAGQTLNFYLRIYPLFRCFRELKVTPKGNKLIPKGV